jgi:hypothetical protein
MNKTASVHYSLDSGATWDPLNNTNDVGKPVVVERVNPGFIQDGPAVPVATVPGRNTVYAAFDRWQGAAGPGSLDQNAQIIVVKDLLGGRDSFGDLGVGADMHKGQGINVIGGGNTVIVPISPMLGSGTSLGHERFGSDLALAVSPTDPDMVYVAYASWRTVSTL